MEIWAAIWNFCLRVFYGRIQANQNQHELKTKAVNLNVLAMFSSAVGLREQEQFPVSETMIHFSDLYSGLFCYDPPGSYSIHKQQECHCAGLFTEHSS